MVECIENTPLNGQTLLHTADFDTRTPGRFHITIVKAIAHVKNIDPATEPLNLEEYTSIEAIDNFIPDEITPSDPCSKVVFEYEDLAVICCSHGYVSIYGPPNLANDPTPTVHHQFHIEDGE